MELIDTSINATKSISVASLVAPSMLTTESEPTEPTEAAFTFDFLL